MTKQDAITALNKAELECGTKDSVIADLKEELRKQIHEYDELSIALQAATLPIDRKRDTYTVAVQTFGKKAQLIMAMEEMAELTKELSKNIRDSNNVSAISEEMADVEIMLEQLKIIFSNRSEVDHIRSEKLLRLAGLLGSETT